MIFKRLTANLGSSNIQRGCFGAGYVYMPITLCMCVYTYMPIILCICVIPITLYICVYAYDPSAWKEEARI